ncbi:MAG TPA: NUDIX domain-containing protein [Candidatus Paceibacterota bacterium]|nr:NUDIX domain-containing protein [Candidatus Paceibacterota bacterium]
MASEDKSKELHRIAVTAIIYKDGKYLITKRAPTENAFPNMWTVPGGGLSTDDYMSTPETHPNQWYYALEKSLRNEIREEVNLEIEKPEYLLDLTLVRPDKTPVLVLSFFAAYKSGEVKLNEDSTDFAWVSFEEAKKYDLIPGILEEIELADKRLFKHPLPSE